MKAEEEGSGCGGVQGGGCAGAQAIPGEGSQVDLSMHGGGWQRSEGAERGWWVTGADRGVEEL